MHTHTSDAGPIYAIIPARSGSKGLPAKNVRLVAGHPLLAYSIAFARTLGVDRVLCSTDSERYADIARVYGADVPFLRSPAAASDTAMEHDVLADLYAGFDRQQIPHPAVFVWLRPTFPFRDRAAVRACIERVQGDGTLTSCRVVVEADARLYAGDHGLLRSAFDDGGLSMVRRQVVPTRYRVFNTDVFRGIPRNDGPRFLGDRAGFEVAPRICGLDIDDEYDARLAESLLTHQRALVAPYVSL